MNMLYITKSKVICVVKYIFLFFLFLLWNLIIQPINLDEIWNYGFAHNIYSGLVPYLDFNMVITPLYPMIMSLPFYIFGSSMLVFHLQQAVILTISCYFLFKLLKDKAWLIILLYFFPLSFSFPSYNCFLFFLFVIILYLEKRNSNDVLIGLILGAVILTKQSVGFCLLIPSLFYVNNKNKILKKSVGVIIPIVCFIAFLIITNSYFAFLDLCVFGLFDFAQGNGNFSFMFLTLTIILIYLTYLLIRKQNNFNRILGYYTLSFYSIIIPLFDINHFQPALMAFLIYYFISSNKTFKFNFRLFSIGIIMGVMIITFIKSIDGKIIYPNNINHFEYRFLDENIIHFTNEVTDFTKDNSSRKVIHLNSNGYYFKLITDEKINYFDLINVGNWGYDGTKKLINAIKKNDDAIFVISKEDFSDGKQTDKKAIKYIINHGKKIKSIKIYDFYILEK